jgi:hypothetical protein
MRIAQRFSVASALGGECDTLQVPKGRLKPSSIRRPSLRDYPASAVDPNAEALGYCRRSLRDKGGAKQWKDHLGSNPSGITLEILPHEGRVVRAQSK